MEKILNENEIKIMEKFKKWIENDYQNRLGHISKSSVYHRMAQVKWLLNNKRSQYNLFDKPCIGHSINKFAQFGSTLRGKQKTEYLKMLTKMLNNYDK